MRRQAVHPSVGIQSHVGSRHNRPLKRPSEAARQRTLIVAFHAHKDTRHDQQMLPSLRVFIRALDHCSCPVVAAQSAPFQRQAFGSLLFILCLEVAHTNCCGIVDADDPDCRTQPIVPLPYGGSRQQLRCENAEVKRVGELREKVSGRADDLLRLFRIVEVLEMVQDRIEELISRHDGAFAAP